MRAECATGLLGPLDLRVWIWEPGFSLPLYLELCDEFSHCSHLPADLSRERDKTSISGVSGSGETLTLGEEIEDRCCRRQRVSEEGPYGWQHYRPGTGVGW